MRLSAFLVRLGRGATRGRPAGFALIVWMLAMSAMSASAQRLEPGERQRAKLGTHVAGLVGGNGADTLGTRRSVAPDANITAIPANVVYVDHKSPFDRAHSIRPPTPP